MHRYPLADRDTRIQAMQNLTECIQVQRVTPKPEHLDWLKNVALKHQDQSFVALAALCLGLMEYDKGTAAETR